MGWYSEEKIPLIFNLGFIFPTFSNSNSKELVKLWNILNVYYICLFVYVPVEGALSEETFGELHSGQKDAHSDGHAQHPPARTLNVCHHPSATILYLQLCDFLTSFHLHLNLWTAPKDWLWFMSQELLVLKKLHAHSHDSGANLHSHQQCLPSLFPTPSPALVATF